MSPRLWWTKFSKSVLGIEAQEKSGPCESQVLRFKQSVFDPALFVCHDNQNVLRGILAVHVDDLLIAIRDDTEELKREVLELFPYGEIQSGKFEYCGKHIETFFEKDRVHEIHVKQANFAQGRLDPIDVEKRVGREINVYGEELASFGEKHDHRSAVGGLGWLAAQSRPDLSFATSEAQRHQNEPSLEDIKRTNKAIGLAKETAEHAHIIRYLDPRQLSLLTYHDAAWANVESEEQILTAAAPWPEPANTKEPRPKHRT